MRSSVSPAQARWRSLVVGARVVRIGARDVVFDRGAASPCAPGRRRTATSLLIEGAQDGSASDDAGEPLGASLVDAILVAATGEQSPGAATRWSRRR